MSKSTNDGLIRSGTGCFIAVPYGNSGRQKIKTLNASIVLMLGKSTTSFEIFVNILTIYDFKKL